MKKNREINRFAKLWYAESSTYNFSVNISIGLVNAFMVKILGYGVLDLGYLIAIRIIAIALSQLPAIFLLAYKRNMRKQVWFICGAINRIGWALVPLALLLPRSQSLIYLAALSFTAQFAGGIGGVAAMDVIGSNIPSMEAPIYFSTMNKLSYASIALSQLTGILLFLYPINLTLKYLLLYILAFLTALISTMILFKIPDNRLEGANSTSSTLRPVETLISDPNLRKYLYIITLFNFAVNIPAPFWDYIVLNLAGGRDIIIPVKNMVNLLVKFFTVNWWQSLIHRKGLKRVLVEGMAFTSLVPLFYFEANSVFTVFFAEAFSGFIWAPVEIGTSIYSVYLPPEYIRPLYLTAVNFITNTVSAIAATVGTTISAATGNVYSALITSTALRAIIAGITYRVLPEVNGVQGSATKH